MKAPWPIERKARQAMASLKDTVRKAIARNVKIGLGTDAAVYPHGRNAEEFHLLVDLGMKPVDALKAGTSANADLLGIADRVGTLEAGKLADIVVCRGVSVTFAKPSGRRAGFGGGFVCQRRTLSQ
jgi:imidazolonepropionase-like amidohydrolase